MENHDSRKRSACDRCRGQKLRCVRIMSVVVEGSIPNSSAAKHTPCERCNKANVLCYTTIHSRSQGTLELSYEPVCSPRMWLDFDIADLLATETTFQYVAHDDAPEQSPHLGSSSGVTQVPNAPISQQDINFVLNRTAQAPPAYSTPTAQVYGSSDGCNNTFAQRRDRTLNPSDELHGSSAQGAYPFAELDLVGSCTMQLSELNARLIRDLIMNKLQSGPPLELPESPPPSALSKFIGSILGNCQEFLDILQRLKSAHMDHTKLSHTSMTELLEQQSSQNASRFYSESDSDISIRQPSTPNTHRHTRGFSGQRLNGPSLFSFSAHLLVLSCYTCILEGFDSIFTVILGMLTEGSYSLDLNLTGILPEFSLGGFRLDGHNDLQIKCLLQVSSMVLVKIENIIGIGATEVGTHNSRNGLLNNRDLGGLLDALYCQEQFDHTGGGGSRVARVKVTMKSIEKILDSA